MTVIEVESVELFVEENSKKHRTDKYEVVHLEEPSAVFRRGEPITASIAFKNRGFNDAFDRLRVIFNYGRVEDGFRGCQGGAWVTYSKEANKDSTIWSARITNQNDNTLMIEVQPSVVAPVGLYFLSIKSSSPSSTKILTYEHPQDVYLLFNPWHKDDSVFMPKVELLDEYVLNDVGKVWHGRSNSRHWVFGHFAASVLKALDTILHKTGLKYENKGNPILLTRAISKLINADDDDEGVLVGKWKKPYDDGTPPSMWTGSNPILEEYNTNGTVKYGQCWVFACVVNTVCRALGIPSRVVTNIVSAHDTDASLTIDRYFNKEGELENSSFGDSTWNFHVWNDVWMARPDLPQGYGGWQAIDATPQETSDGVYQCGPGSLEAIKRGEIGLKYDVPFLLSEVNADILHWKEDDEALLGYKRINSNKTEVGRIILTKKPFIFDPNGEGDREDITYQYKNPEGTREERLTFHKAVQHNKISCLYYDVPDCSTKTVCFSIKPIDEINIGEPFEVVVDMENVSDNPYTVTASLSAVSVYYTGIKAHNIKKDTKLFTMKPKSKKQFKMNIEMEEYMDKLVEFNMIKIYAIATIQETKQTWAGEDDLQVVKPSLEIQTAGKDVELGLSTRISFIFKNPLKKKLTNCKLIYESPGLLKHARTAVNDVLPEQEVTIETYVTPMVSGEYKIVAIFHSKELQDINGSATLNVICY